MKKRTGLFFIILVLLASLCAFALADVAIDEDHFPDECFLEIIELYDEDENGILSDAEIAEITELECEESDISTLKGIEYLTALEELNCDGNTLTALDLSSNTALTTLYCNSNDLSSLKLTKNTALAILQCSDNSLTSLDVRQNTKLKELICTDNDELSSLKLGKKNSLKILDCCCTDLSELDISGCRILARLVRGSKPNDFMVDDTVCYGWWIDAEEEDDPPEVYLSIDEELKVITESEEEPEDQPEPSSATVANGKYELNEDKTAAVFTGPVKTGVKTLTVKDTVRIGKKTYRVLSISASACKGMKNLAMLTVGKFVKRIGASAFQNCRKLKTVTFRGSNVERIDSNAFKKVKSTIRFRCPAKKLSSYRKLIKAAGAPKKARYVKK